MVYYQQLLEQVRQYILEYFRSHPYPALMYHNQKHTEDVVAAVKQIGGHFQLNDRDYFIVNAAAWFHDVGYYSCRDGHEESGSLMAEAFLRERGLPEEVTIAVKNCILATHMPQHPSTLNEMIVCDADLFHLGTDNFREKNRLMRREYEALTGNKVSKQAWRQSTIRLFEQHRYHTDYCRLLLDRKKEENLRALKSKEDEKQKSDPVIGLFPVSDAIAAAPEADKLRKKNKDRPERGIETMFRISSSNHQRLSDMADNKSHILITVNSIILSAIISLLLRRLEDHIYLAAPTFILLTVSLLTIIYAILATRPTIPPGTFTSEDIDRKEVNLLFFGNFYKMSLEDYAAGMWKTMEDKSFLYGSLIRDVYSQGIVLGRKYRLLRAAYNIFMFGLITAVLAFIIASAIHGKD